MSNEKVYNVKTGASHISNGFAGTLSNQGDVKVMARTFRNIARMIPQIKENPKQWQTNEHYLGCLFVAAFERAYEQNDSSLIDAFTINRICETVKDNLAPTYVKGTLRFQENLDVFNSYGFPQVRSRLKDQVNLGSKVLRSYPARLNIDWIARAATELMDIQPELADFKNECLVGLNDVCPKTLLEKWKVIASNDTDLLVAMGIDAMEHAPHHLTDTDNYGEFIQAFRSLLDTLLTSIPYHNLDLFDPANFDEEVEEDDDDLDDTFAINGVEEEVEDDEEDEEDLDEEDLDEDDEEDEDEDDEDWNAPKSKPQPRPIEADGRDDELEDYLKELDEETELDDEELDELDEEDEDTLIEDSPRDAYPLLAKLFGKNRVQEVIRKLFDESGLPVDTDYDGDLSMSLFDPKSGKGAEFISTIDLLDELCGDSVSVGMPPVWNLMSVIGASPALAADVVKALDIPEIESFEDLLREVDDNPDVHMSCVLRAALLALTTYNTTLPVDKIPHEDRMVLAAKFTDADLSRLTNHEINVVLSEVPIRTLFNEYIAMHEKQMVSPVLEVSEDVQAAVGRTICCLSAVDLKPNTDYRVELSDMCEALDNFELPLDPTFRTALLTGIEYMLTEKFGEVTVASQFEMRGVFFKFTLVELQKEDTTTISLMEVLTSDDFDAEPTKEDSAEDDDNVAGDENYALKS